MVVFDDRYEGVISFMIGNIIKGKDFCFLVDCDECPFCSKNNKFNTCCNTNTYKSTLSNRANWNDLFNDLLELHRIIKYKGVKRFR